MRRLAIGMMVLLGAAAARAADCGSLVRSADGLSVDLAPPSGYVDVCADKELCKKLTHGYDAATVSTLAYLVPQSEWPKPADAPPPGGFKRYLIAQLAPSKKPENLAALKALIRSQTAVPAAKLGEVLAKDGQASLGVLDETPTSISFGAAMKRDPGVLAMSNTAMVLKNRVLSLYVYANLAGAEKIAELKDLTNRWIGCLRAANP
ncbi:MAG: hypothetical protein SF182_20075 [Deltaproteobacteria bacterium]|nr:hypothetical protein [Deltaproteobacteria bacterium]